MISLIWAMDNNCLIGKDNKMPWHVKEDLLYFKEMTRNQVVVMGYHNYLSLKGYYRNKPFPYRKSYVLTHNTLEDNSIHVVHSIQELMEKENEFFVIGGKNVYKQFFPLADFLYITYILGSYEGDTYMDDVDLSEFDLISQRETDLAKYTIFKRKK